MVMRRTMLGQGRLTIMRRMNRWFLTTNIMKPEVWGPDFWLGALDFILRAFSTHWESLLGKLLGSLPAILGKLEVRPKKRKEKRS